mmetsp:Transcript_22607/g.36954  ORF Transcript_22607/g.36954 Transcript_22607/m.36954 type:complete len:807 (+) Transcript_22607:6797-9217(+)
MCCRRLRAVCPRLNVPLRRSTGTRRARTSSAPAPDTCTVVQASDCKVIAAYAFSAASGSGPASNTISRPNQIARAPSLPVALFGPGKAMPCADFNASLSALLCPLYGASDVSTPRSTSAKVTVPMVIEAISSSGVFARNSTTGPSSFWIKEHRVAQFHLRLDPPQMVHHAQGFAMTGHPVFDKAETQKMADCRREPDRRDVSLVMGGHCVLSGRINMRACGQLLDRANRFQAHKLWPPFGHQTGSRGHGLADAVLFGRNHPLHPQIAGRHPPVDFRVRDKAFLDAQHIQRFHPIGTARHRLGPREKQREQSGTIARRHRQFISMFPRERDAEEPPSDPLHRHRTAGHKGPCLIVDWRIQKPAKQVAGKRACNGKLRPLFGDRHDPHVPFGTQGLCDKLQVAHHLTRGSRGRGHHVMVRTQSRRGPVIHDKAVLAQHQAIAHAPLFEGREHVSVNKIQKAGRIWPLNVDLAQGRHITNPNRIADIADLAITGLPPCRFPFNGEIGRAIPLPRLDHRGLGRNARSMAGREPFGGKALALRSRAQRGQRHRAIGWAERGCPGFWNTAPCCIGQKRQRRHIGILALVRRHPLGGIAFHMLHRGEVFHRRLFDVLHAHIVLEIQPRAATPCHRPERRQVVRRIVGRRQIYGIGHKAKRFHRLLGFRCPFFQRSESGKRPVARPRRGHTRYHAVNRAKTLDVLAPRRTPVHMARQVHCRIPATRNSQTICTELFFATDRSVGNTFQRLATASVAHLCTPDHRITLSVRTILSTVQHGRHMHTGGFEISRCAVPIIIIGEHRHRLARRHAITL